MARFGGVDAFGCNSANIEPIWMKSGALSVLSTLSGLMLAYFGATAAEPGDILFYFVR